MDARNVWIPGQINLVESNQGGKLHWLAGHKQKDSQQILSGDQGDPKGTFELVQEECQVNQTTQERTMQVGRSGEENSYIEGKEESQR